MVLRALLAALVLAVSAPVTAGVAASPAAAAARPAAGLRAEPGDPVKWYRVRPSFNGDDEYLYEIAERFLGDGDRNPEIFALNKGRRQPDGGALTVADRIEPGWVLQLPDDADGPGLEFGPLPDPTASASAPAPAPGPASAPARAAQPPAGRGMLPVLLGLGVVLILAGLVLAVVLVRRRKAVPAAEVVPRQRTGSSFGAAASWTIDRALRVLVTSARAAGRPVPPVYGVTVDDNAISLRLSSPDSPVEPWESRDGGLVWVAALRSLQALPVDPEAGTPCPRLVTLGLNGGSRELLDLGHAPGPISVRGDATATRALLAGWATELTDSPWSSGVRVVAGGLLPEVADQGRVTSVPALGDALTEAAGEAAVDPAADPDPAGGPAGGPVGDPAGDGWLGVLMLGAAPAGPDADRLRNLAARPDGSWAVVVLGRTRHAGWELTLRPDGRLDTSRLGAGHASALEAG